MCNLVKIIVLVTVQRTVQNLVMLWGSGIMSDFQLFGLSTSVVPLTKKEIWFGKGKSLCLGQVKVEIPPRHPQWNTERYI